MYISLWSLCRFYPVFLTQDKLHNYTPPYKSLDYHLHISILNSFVTPLHTISKSLCVSLYIFRFILCTWVRIQTGGWNFSYTYYYSGRLFVVCVYMDAFMSLDVSFDEYVCVERNFICVHVYMYMIDWHTCVYIHVYDDFSHKCHLLSHHINCFLIFYLFFIFYFTLFVYLFFSLCQLLCFISFYP